MKFNVSTAFIAVLAACASSVFAQSVDWNSADSQACAQKNWAAIKQQVDVTIAENWEFLPSFIKDVVKQSGALNADNTLVSNPTGAQLVVLATSFPSGIFNPYANDIVQQCLTATPSETETETEEPSTSSEEPSASSEEPSASSEEPSASSEEPSASSEEPSASSEEPSASSEEPSESASEEPSESASESASESQEESESASESASQSQEESESASESASESQEESESESVSEDPTSSAPEATAEPSSTPIKCIPRH
ncbi:hypothetical protein IW137_000389 [Coemansia sp. RSA 1287]|nr:hypothetical protein GGH98_001653 [Coemansia sp. RSA 454]KAJ2652169.1 hypothetical protein IW137_000389 [Coemansia sp. RSA 1287]